MTLHGVIPPVCTPLTPAGEVATDDLRRLISFLLDEGVHGLFLLGSTSEAIGLTDDQQETVMSTGLAAAAGRVPVVVGCIDFTTRRVIERGLRAKAHGADGIVACAPFYLKPDQAEITRHYTRVREAVDLPILAYDIPGAVQTKIERPTLAALAAGGVLSGLKDSSGQEANFRGVLMDTAAIPGFSVFTGSELMADVALWLGAAGIVPGMGNVDPGGYVRLYDAARAGDWETAKAEQARLYRLFDIVHAGIGPGIGLSAAAWGSFKVALKLRGVITSATPTAPMSTISPEAEEKIGALLKEAGLGAVAAAV